MDVDQRQNGTPKAKFGPKKSSRGDLYVGSAALSYRRDHMEVSWGFLSQQKSTALLTVLHAVGMQASVARP